MSRHREQLALLAALDVHARTEDGPLVVLSPEASVALRGWWRSAPLGGDLGRALRALRCARGLSQGELAPRASVSQGQLSRYEAGDGAPPDAGVLVLLLDGLDATPAEREAVYAAARTDRQRRAGR